MSGATHTVSLEMSGATHTVSVEMSGATHTVSVKMSGATHTVSHPRRFKSSKNLIPKWLVLKCNQKVSITFEGFGRLLATFTICRRTSTLWPSPIFENNISTETACLSSCWQEERQLLIWLSKEALLSVSVHLFVIATNSTVASTAFDLRTKQIQFLTGCVPFRMTDGGHRKDSLLSEVQSLSLLTDGLLCKLFNGTELNNCVLQD